MRVSLCQHDQKPTKIMNASGVRILWPLNKTCGVNIRRMRASDVLYNLRVQNKTDRLAKLLTDILIRQRSCIDQLLKGRSTARNRERRTPTFRNIGQPRGNEKNAIYTG